MCILPLAPALSCGSQVSSAFSTFPGRGVPRSASHRPERHGGSWTKGNAPPVGRRPGSGACTCPADTEGSSLSPRIKRRIRTKTSLAEIERKERGRSQIPAPPRLRTLLADAAETPISEGSLVPVSTPTSDPQRAHPYTPVGNAMGSSSFEMVPPVRARAASDRGFDGSADTIPIARANSSPSIIQVPTHSGTYFAFFRLWA